MYFKKKNQSNSLISISNIQLSDRAALKEALIKLNDETAGRGLFLSEKNINKLSDAVQSALKESDRIEIGMGIMPALAREFSNAFFVDKDNYVFVLERLIHVFFHIKTATCDKIPDREIVRLMRDYFDNKGMSGNWSYADEDTDNILKFIEMETGKLTSTPFDVFEADGYIDERA